MRDQSCNCTHCRMVREYDPTIRSLQFERDELKKENEELLLAIEPFAKIIIESSGDIPMKKLSLANWHYLVKVFRESRAKGGT